MTEVRRGSTADETGMTTTQVAILFPALLFWIMLIVQYGLWFHAKQVANAAVAEATDTAQVPNGSDTDGEEAALAFLTQAGNLRAVTVSVERSTAEVVAEVHGQAPRLVPGFDWAVTSRAAAPLERFVPEGER